jgi:nitroreductase
MHSSGMLRRNIHRLEKGLTMRGRQSVFALDYIGETVALYRRLSVSMEPNEAVWAHDVLAQYFHIVARHPSVDRWRQQFQEIGNPRERVERIEPQLPYRASERAPPSIDLLALHQLAQRRRSVRWFLSTPVPRDLVCAAMRVAREAPSACNRQPYFFKFIDDSGHAQRVASIAMGTTGYADQIPSLVVVIGDWSCLAEERDRHIPYIDGALAAMQFMLACETLGLGTCPINWPDVERLERRMDRALGLPLYQRPVMLIAVGYPDPDGGVARSTKKPVGDLLR